MSGPAHEDIKRLIAWSEDSEPLSRGPLTAELSEALAGEAGAEAGDIALTAAYLDGRLDAQQRDAFAARLAASAGERVDIDAAAALLERVERAPQRAPAHLLAQAKERFEQTSAAAAPARPARRGIALAGLFGSRLAWSMAAGAAAVVIVPLSMLRTQTAAPFANAPTPAPSVGLAQPVGGSGGIVGAPAIMTPPPSAPPAQALPTQPQILSEPSAADQVAAADQSATDSSGVMRASDRCGAEGAATSNEPGHKSATARERQAREACEAERALARRRAQTLAAAREPDFHAAAAAADTAPAAEADAYRPLPAQAPAQAYAPPAR